MAARNSLLDLPQECYSFTDAGKILDLSRTQIETIVKAGELFPVKSWSRARPRIPRWQILERLGLPFDAESYGHRPAPQVEE